VTVDGALVGTNALFGPGRSLEFVATFSASPFQHIGFGADLNGYPWAIFSTGFGGGSLMANTSLAAETQTDLGAVYLNAPHRYRIEWTATQVIYYVDGVQVASHAESITSDLRPLISDGSVGGTTLVVDWLRMSPYASPCEFVSRSFDAGGSVQWLNLVWTGSEPADTTVTFQTRTSPDNVNWTAWAPLSGGSITSPAGRYLQYQATETTANNLVTPIIESVSVSYQLGAPDVSIDSTQLSWPAVPGADGYRVYQSTVPYFAAPPPAPVEQPGLTYNLPQPPVSATNYYYLVRAYKGGTESDVSNPVGRFTFDLTPGAAP
jgi:hypothetical protein